MKFTKHGAVRMRQRGKSEEDLSMIRRYGKHLGGGAFFFGNRNADKARRDIQREFGTANPEAKPIIQRLDHLVGWTVVMGDDGEVVTCYPVTRERRTRIKVRYH